MTHPTETDREQPKALELADWLQSAVQAYPQMSEDDPGGYCSELDQKIDFAASELRTQHAELEALKKSLALVQQHHATSWNRGHMVGLRSAKEQIDMAQDAVKRDAWGNSQLTEALIAAESERDALRADVERERESRKAAQARQEELTAEVVRLEPMRQRAADIERLTAEVERLREDAARLNLELDAQRLYARALCKAVDTATDFAGTVAGGSSWWDDVWAEQAAALDRARDRITIAAQGVKG